MERTNLGRILIDRIGKGHNVIPQHVHIHDLIHQTQLTAGLRTGLGSIILDHFVHLLDGAFQGFPGLMLLGQTAGVHGSSGGFAVHHVDFRGSRTQGESVGIVALRTAHHVMSRGGTLPQGDLQLRHIAVLDGVNQGLTQTQKLRFFSNIAYIDTGGILNPHNRNLIPAAQGDELIHLD